jgi:hypothetical protein
MPDYAELCRDHKCGDCHRCLNDYLLSLVGDADKLLGRWMVWASGVAFKSPDGEQIEKDTDAFLGRQR